MILQADYEALKVIAKTKKDGVYSKKLYTYAVKSNKVVAYSTYGGFLYRCHGSFTSSAGRVSPYEVRKTLLEFIKNY